MQVIINFIFILIISVILFFIFSYDASLDEHFILSLLLIISLQISLILAILLKRR